MNFIRKKRIKKLFMGLAMWKLDLYIKVSNDIWAKSFFYEHKNLLDALMALKILAEKRQQQTGLEIIGFSGQPFPESSSTPPVESERS